MAKSNKDNNELSFKFNEKCDNACVKKDTLIIYSSLSGNTAKIALVAAKTLGAHCYEIGEFCDKFKINLDENLDTDFIYLANPISQFSKFSNLASFLSTTAKFYANSEFLRKFGLENAKFIQIYKDDSADKITLEICIDENCTNGYIPYFDDKICTEKLFKTRFAKLNFKAINLDVLKGENFAKDPNFTQANLEQNADEILAKQGAQSE